MAKGAYIGVSNVARKVKKAYIGVNGVARLFWSGGGGGLMFIARDTSQSNPNRVLTCSSETPSSSSNFTEEAFTNSENRIFFCVYGVDSNCYYVIQSSYYVYSRPVGGSTWTAQSGDKSLTDLCRPTSDGLMWRCEKWDYQSAGAYAYRLEASTITCLGSIYNSSYKYTWTCPELIDGKYFVRAGCSPKGIIYSTDISSSTLVASIYQNTQSGKCMPYYGNSAMPQIHKSANGVYSHVDAFQANNESIKRMYMFRSTSYDDFVSKLSSGTSTTQITRVSSAIRYWIKDDYMYFMVYGADSSAASLGTTGIWRLDLSSTTSMPERISDFYFNVGDYYYNGLRVAGEYVYIWSTQSVTGYNNLYYSKDCATWTAIAMSSAMAYPGLAIAYSK